MVLIIIQASKKLWCVWNEGRVFEQCNIQCGVWWRYVEALLPRRVLLRMLQRVVSFLMIGILSMELRETRT